MEINVKSNFSPSPPPFQSISAPQVSVQTSSRFRNKICMIVIIVIVVTVILIIGFVVGAFLIIKARHKYTPPPPQKPGKFLIKSRTSGKCVAGALFAPCNSSDTQQQFQMVALTVDDNTVFNWQQISSNYCLSSFSFHLVPNNCGYDAFKTWTYNTPTGQITDGFGMCVDVNLDVNKLSFTPVPCDSFDLIDV